MKRNEIFIQKQKKEQDTCKITQIQEYFLITACRFIFIRKQIIITLITIIMIDTHGRCKHVDSKQSKKKQRA